MDIESINERLAEIYSGTPWVIIVDAAAAASNVVNALRGWGVDRFLVISATEGTGEIPEDVEIHLTGSRGETVMGGFREFARSLRNPDVAEALSAFDPDRVARIIAPTFEEAVFDRETYGARRSAWRALEDKTMIDGVLDDAGVARSESAVVGVSEAAGVADELGSHLGTVWVADNTEGWHGGGEYTRWVPGPDHHDDATKWFSERARFVRVMPFLDGLPCSIHGYVTSTGVATFRPVEMLVARTTGMEPFRYMGVATTWDPPSRLREEMRTAARRLGAHLRERVGYRGPFSIDGVATAEGFLPTEVNPRLSIGFGVQTMGLEGLNIGLLTRALYEDDIEVDVEWLESTIVANADCNRVLRAGIPFTEVRELDEIDVRVHATSIEAATSDRHGVLHIGPSPAGCYVLLKLEQEHIPVGPSGSRLAVSAAELAASTWDLDLRPLTAMTDIAR